MRLSDLRYSATLLLGMLGLGTVALAALVQRPLLSVWVVAGLLGTLGLLEAYRRARQVRAALVPVRVRSGR